MESAIAVGTDSNPARLLDLVDVPADLRRLPLDKLPLLAAEIRELMIDTVSRRGGHLASSLGAVELSIALHYAFDTPNDKLIWDVGHQAYAHKILTGRRKHFDTLRQYGGISGFPRTLESDYDAVSTGHASTSISAGLGLAIARDLKKEKREIISVIGDGSLSGGLAFEGLNNLGNKATKMIVVLNDNRMSISRNVGALSRYLTRLITDRRFQRIKSEVWELLGNMSNVGKGIRNLVHNVDDALKHFVIPGKLFEDMGLHYLGPVDGHNIAEMTEVFRFVRDSMTLPVLVHVITTKGKGYRYAEIDATKYHGVSAFSRATGNAPSASKPAPTYSKVFGDTLIELARRRSDIVAVTAAMPDGTGLTAFREQFPDRLFDVGIAESHAVTFAAGLALSGMRPVIAMYSTFLQRAFDQIIHDVALDNLKVVICIDRAGIVGDDGPTHHGALDVSFLRFIPNLVIMAPSNERELRDMLRTAVEHAAGPVCIRYPRGEGTGISLDTAPDPVSIGKPLVVRTGSQCAIVALGDTVNTVLRACPILGNRGIRPTVVDARFVKPLDEAFYRDLFAAHSHVVTVESNSLAGGFGSAILELAVAQSGGNLPGLLRLGYPDAFIPQGETALLHKELLLDAEGIAHRVDGFVRGA